MRQLCNGPVLGACTTADKNETRPTNGAPRRFTTIKKWENFFSNPVESSLVRVKKKIWIFALIWRILNNPKLVHDKLVKVLKGGGRDGHFSKKNHQIGAILYISYNGGQNNTKGRRRQRWRRSAQLLRCCAHRTAPDAIQGRVMETTTLLS